MTIVGKKLVAVLVPPPPRHGTGKGLMTTQGPIPKKRPLFLREDPRRVARLFSSIIKDDDYEDLGNHATEAMGETGLFGLAQVHNHPPSLPFLIYSILVLTVS